ncbi:MAG: hypothetical protein ACTSUE_22945 [Promethearchaeota archaeon]
MSPIENIIKRTYELDDNYILVCFLSEDCAPCQRVKPFLEGYMTSYNSTKVDFEMKLSQTKVLRVPSGTRVRWIKDEVMTTIRSICPLPNFTLCDPDGKMVETLQFSDPDILLPFLIETRKITVINVTASKS